MALSGGYDFQFMIGEPAVGAQHELPYVHVVVNTPYLGLIRQAQRSFQTDFEVSLAFNNINADPGADAVQGYGLDHVTVAEGLGKALRVHRPEEIVPALERDGLVQVLHDLPAGNWEAGERGIACHGGGGRGGYRSGHPRPRRGAGPPGQGEPAKGQDLLPKAGQAAATRRRRMDGDEAAARSRRDDMPAWRIL